MATMSLGSMPRVRPSSAWETGPSSATAESTAWCIIRRPSEARASATRRWPRAAARPSSQLGSARMLLGA